MEGCNGTCIMEGRINYIQEKLDKQAKDDANNRAANEGRMVRMEVNIEKVLDGLNAVNEKLSAVLEDQQNDEIERAKGLNKGAAGKWNLLSGSTRNIAEKVLAALAIAAITYLITKHT